MESYKNFSDKKNAALEHMLGNNDIRLRNGEKIITDEKKLMKFFNDHCINIVEQTCGIKPGSSYKNGILKL